MFEPDYKFLINHLQGNSSKREQELLENWIQSSRENKELFSEIERIWDKEGALDPEFSPDEARAWKKIESGIKPVQKLTLRRFASAISVAAVIAGLLLGVYFIQHRDAEDSTNFFAAAAQIYQADSMQQVILPDGSKIWLNRGARLGIDSAFASEERKVYLKGESYFEVARDTGRQFIVITNHTQTHVLGTSFSIEEQTGSKTEINVLSGRVSFSAPENEKSIILLPGDKSVYATKSDELVKEKTINPNFLSWHTLRFEFKDQSLEEVCDQLAKVYQINIKIKNKKLRIQQLTASFEHQTAEEIFEVIRETLACEVEFSNQTIIIK